MFDKIKALQAEGNAYYADGRYEAAREIYTKAITLLTAHDNNVLSSDPRNGDTISWESQTASQLLSNRAQTSIQERNFAAALQDATLALRYNAENEKALLRKLVALENLERFEAALHLVNNVLDGGKRNARTLFQYCVIARRRLHKNLARDCQVAAEEVKQMGKMVHDTQQLRINFGCLLPSQVPPNQFFNVAVNIGNEFGLFRREYVKEGEPIYLQCSLQNKSTNKYKLVFEEPFDVLDDINSCTVDANGKVKLNEHGKASFRVAIGNSDEMESASTLESVALEIQAHESIRAKWDLLPVVSLPLFIVSQGGESKEGVTGQLGVHCCRTVKLPGVAQDILLAESPGNLGIGGKLWDSCLVLTRFLAARQDLIRNKQVVELGSGLGLVGIFCSLLGAHVTLTDMKEIIPLIEYNISLNYCEEGQRDDKGKGGITPIARAHHWGESPCNLPVQPDVIVLSDVVYDPIGYAPLVSSLVALATCSKTLVLMAYRSRNPLEYQFFELLSQSFSCERIHWLSTEKSALKACAAGGLPTTKQVLEDVQIFEIRRLTV
ncbi:Putative N2,N2-dimethylguanosine tRNA methyltransferase [Plasmopara halstedii]|uniref:Putative N2,N2-dimethylguanosine tRNA methyltransferase n=1 Tax=Plasmopara halstedii TaxID=4781 RepID=A0A0P1A5D9_PLAHL|nr:Putative N2,N2-dimethylguanosine tRNA methyltransferase [Plasmopara halstedii]CEG35442.1 Putative N2,N2-dimethylguanosine tRNA methyltransferase [Plasmopara halstedii]|eukprot:XP_024571811.1 Putative N2,N2-dimethylguanosine tRNA methyltransferase [Plasmopara halstedii]